MSNKFKFDQVIKQFKGGSVNCMREIAMANKNYFVRTFTMQGWDGKKWQEVQRRIPGTPAYEYPKKRDLRRRTRPILVGKGTLRRAVNSSLKTVTGNKVVYEVTRPYAEVHNDGLPMKNGFAMPRRQFMGYSKQMAKVNIDIINKYANKSFSA